jgi:hypothetical protein
VAAAHLDCEELIEVGGGDCYKHANSPTWTSSLNAPFGSPVVTQTGSMERVLAWGQRGRGAAPLNEWSVQ